MIAGIFLSSLTPTNVIRRHYVGVDWVPSSSYLLSCNLKKDTISRSSGARAVFLQLLNQIKIYMQMQDLIWGNKEWRRGRKCTNTGSMALQSDIIQSTIRGNTPTITTS